MSPQPLVFTAQKQARILLGVSAGTIVVGLLVVVSSLVVEQDSTATGAVGFVIGLVLLVLGLVFLRSYGAVRSYMLSIGPQGIFVRRAGVDSPVAWHEIAAVGVTVPWARAPGMGPKAMRTQIVVRIRIAPVVPAFSGRPDMVRFVTHDEPVPYTHKISLPAAVLATETSVPEAEQLGAALAWWAPQQFTGVEYRQTTVGRYT